MYTENDDPVPYDEYIQHVSEVVKATAERGVKLPFILMEPGRFNYCAGGYYAFIQ